MTGQPQSNQPITAALCIPTLSCGACIERIEKALRPIDGVSGISVDLPTRMVKVTFDTAKASLMSIRSILESAGYPSTDDPVEVLQKKAGANYSHTSLRPILWGFVAGASIIGFYLGLNTLTADWFFAKAQFYDYRWWLIALSGGLGTQVALYTAFRAHITGAARRAATSSMATSGGVSAASMAACCAHYLLTFLPVLSVPFFSAAAASLEKYQNYFFMAGIVSCAVGLALMIRLLNKNGVSPLAAVGLSRKLETPRICH